MAKRKQPTGDNIVGYGNPPKEHQFKKGKSGNPKGRPKSKKSDSTDISELLDEPVKVRVGDNERNMPPFEAGLRQLVRKALGKDLPATLKFVRLCEEYGIIAPPTAATDCRVIFAPKGVDFQEWLESVTEEVPVDEA